MIPTVKSANISLVFQGQDDQSMNMNMDYECIKTPLVSDILCGKNKICIKHEGSKNFRNIIESYTAKYQAATSRQAKMDITKEIFDRLQNRRFLKYNDETDMWETLHPLAVRDKIGHALRFSNRKGPSAIRKQVRRSTSDVTPMTRLTHSSGMGMSRSTGNIGSTLGNDSRVEENVSNAPMNEAPMRFSTGTMPEFTDLVQQMLALEQNGTLLQQALMPTSNKQLPTASFTLGGQMSMNSARSSFNLGNWNFNSLKLDDSSLNPRPIESMMNKRSSLLSQASGEDLSWMLQMPLMEMETDGQVYIVDGQPSINV